MKKVLLWSGLGLLLVLGLAPYWFGRQAEPLLQTFLAEVGAACQVPVRTTHYRRGWFQSTAETVIELPSSVGEAFRMPGSHTTPASGPHVVLTMTHQLLHGPFAWPTILRGQAFSPAPIQLHLDTVMHLQVGTVLVTAADPIRIATTLGLAGGAWIDLVLPAGQAHVGPQEEDILRWQAWQGHVTLTASGPRLTGTLGTAAVTGEGRQGAITAHDFLVRVEASVDAQRYHGTLLVQGQRLELVSRTEQPPDMTLQGWDIRSSATMMGESLDVTTMAHVETIQTATNRYGPATGTLAMRRLHTMSLLTLMRTVLPRVPATATPHGPELMSLDSLLAMLPAFAKQSPEVEFTQVRLQTPAGEVRGQANIGLDMTKAPGLMALLRPVNAVVGQGEVAAPVALLQQLLPPAAYEQLQQLEQQGYVVRHGEHYVWTARLARGQLLVNNKPLALSPLGG